ncbi:unnamed protein product [Cylindrotheca closterium]|uniref:Programmed cell death protein 5 n=1 Tax=Cylindrotheca closterium TaxID=2856 RepID=A0AAD2G9Z4_9STRA|nr:unnamed protein product [Cylindrotheca closterium]
MDSHNIQVGQLPQGFTTIDPNSSNASNAAEQNQLQIQEKKQMILEQALTQEALARLGRIKMVKQEKAAAVENLVVSLVMQGKLPAKINEGKLIEMLERGARRGGQEAKQTSIKVQRKRYSLDSDDEDDDDLF